MRWKIFGRWSVGWRLFGGMLSGRQPSGSLSSARNYYLIEFRLHGYARATVRRLRAAIVKNFDVKIVGQRYVPHVTIVGPCRTRDRKKLIRTVEGVVKKYDLVDFKIVGFGSFTRRAVYVDISPSDELARMRQDLVEKLGKFCVLPDYDYRPKFDVHATLCLNTEFPGQADENIELTFDGILEFLRDCQMPEMNSYVLRVTILGGNSKIVREYDLVLKKMLRRREALDMDTFNKTLDAFGKKHGIDVSDMR